MKVLFEIQFGPSTDVMTSPARECVVLFLKKRTPQISIPNFKLQAKRIGANTIPLQQLPHVRSLLV